MDIPGKIDEAVNKLENKTDELVGKAKEKIGEKLTEEKKAEYREKFDSFMNTADEEITRFGKNVGDELKNMFGKKEEK